MNYRRQGQGFLNVITAKKGDFHPHPNLYPVNHARNHVRPPVLVYDCIEIRKSSQYFQQQNKTYNTHGHPQVINDYSLNQNKHSYFNRKRSHAHAIPQLLYLPMSVNALPRKLPIANCKDQHDKCKTFPFISICC